MELPIGLENCKEEKAVFTTHRVSGLVAALALSICSACAGSPVSGTKSFSPVSGEAPVQQSRIAVSSVGAGLAPHVERLDQSSRMDVRLRGHAPARKLYVSDFGTGEIDVFQAKTYQLIGTISNGITDPNGMWVDSVGDLYAANSPNSPSQPGAYVAEYKPGNSSPLCTYSAGLADPVTVTTDRSGDVYVADWNFGSSGFVDRYTQCGQTISTQYVIDGSPGGVAVDAAGNLFVLYNSHATGAGALEEFPAGSTNPTMLKARVHYAAGLILGGKGDLLASDQGGSRGFSTLDRIAPPYNRVNHLYRGFGDAFRASLSKNGELLFVADPKDGEVHVLDYPSGKTVTTLGSANGLVEPAGVAASPDLTP